ncbi:PREDICTED: mutS protein homolog 4-like [Priapulus caudatus]|uniref:MutS protein homolog 4-like n=1 Tax=Priapulus caudatus TaxID=37621 RepID=A0ABM1F9H1_PRICU|nr:PREDICTED: mutS protein homolog 4-like [Priapulus caudatus]
MTVGAMEHYVIRNVYTTWFKFKHKNTAVKERPIHFNEYRFCCCGFQCASIVEGRGQARGEIGMASLDLKTPMLVLSQFSDSQTYVKVSTRLNILQPLEVIMPTNSCENGNATKLFKLISDSFSDRVISTVQRKYFNESKGLQYIRHLCLPEHSSVQLEVSQKYYCLAAAAALLKYVEFIQNTVYAPESLKVAFCGSEHTTMIDATTATNLELICNLLNPKSDHSLYGILKVPQTPGGARLLRANLLQPPCDRSTIEMRLDCVQELTEKEEMFYNLQALLERFTDIDHLVSLCVQIPKQETVKTADSKIASIISMKHTLELVDALQTALGCAEAPLLKAYYNSLSDPRFEQILQKIRAVIHDDTRLQKGALNMRTQKCFAVRPNINGLLDVARRTYTEIVDDIAESVKELAQQFDLPLRTAYNTSRGFFIQMGSDRRPDERQQQQQLPACFIKVARSKAVMSCTTSDLIKMNDRVTESIQEIYLMSNIVVTELLNEIRANISCVYKVAECVSMLDMLLAFAHTCTVSNYGMPAPVSIMQDVNYIMQNASHRSLIIIDELGRGTSAEEGVGLCFAICEYLVNIKAFTIFATHFFELKRLQTLYPNVENYHFEVHHVREEGGSGETINFTHLLSKGVTKETNYGRLPLDENRENEGEGNGKTTLISSEVRKAASDDTQHQHAAVRLATRLVQTAHNSQLDLDSLRLYLHGLRNQYLQQSSDQEQQTNSHGDDVTMAASSQIDAGEGGGVSLVAECDQGQRTRGNNTSGSLKIA